ncbi:MAG: DNA gyrase C-terminal beta-propeller domain-containing protein, partial [Herbaspirillum sp.]
PNGRGDGMPINTLIDIAPGARVLHYYAGSAATMLLLASDSGYGFTTQAGDMVSRTKGGKAFMTLDSGTLPLVPQALAADASALACLSSSGRLLVFGLAEIKTLASGGRGVKLMELEANDKLLALQVISQRGVRVLGTGRGGKQQEIHLSATALGAHIGKRARKGKLLAAKIKPTTLAAIQ